jgi:hypothetical protein
VFRNRQLARASVRPVTREEETVAHSATTEHTSSITPEGRVLLEQARDVDLEAAIFRNRVINPDQYADDEQTQINVRATTIPARTKRRWRRWYREQSGGMGAALSACYLSLLALAGNERLVQRLSNSSTRFLKPTTIR